VALELIAIEQLEHRFDVAVRALDDLLERDPSNAQAWLMRASIALTRGRFAESTSACTRLVFTADTQTAGACIAAVQTMTGRAQEAREFFAAAFARGDYETDAALESWARTVAAETAVALDLPSEADAEFHAALATARRDGGRPTTYLVSAHVDFLLDSGRYMDALALLRDAPLNDATLLRAATAKKRLGLAVDEEIRILSHHLELTLSEHEQTHGREAAYFLRHVLDEPADALAFAVRNFAEQRELLDARLVLESALAVCDAAAAAPVLDWMRANAVEHAMLARLRDSLEECR
jgi:tetratricopeptide (TPR) repeat protein